jgi:hypothetical protein
LAKRKAGKRSRIEVPPSNASHPSRRDQRRSQGGIPGRQGTPPSQILSLVRGWRTSLPDVFFPGRMHRSGLRAELGPLQGRVRPESGQFVLHQTTVGAEVASVSHPASRARAVVRHDISPDDSSLLPEPLHARRNEQERSARHPLLRERI